MVDCTSSRCAQDRRIIKKELLSWTKKVPLLVGLEQVASVVAGKRLMKELLRPFNDLEPAAPVDWDSEDPCSFCASAGGPKTDRDATVSETHSQAEGDLHDLDTMTTCTASDDFRVGNSQFPFKYFSLKSELQQDENAPLDLSMSSTQQQDLKDRDSKSAAVPTKSGCRSGKRKDGSNKKSYTEEELCAAVHDIRTGKLGTRRAAALYGIPRSTLRNKIFRMESSGAAAESSTGGGGGGVGVGVGVGVGGVGVGVGVGGNGAGRLSMSDLLQGMAANGGEYADPLKHLPPPLQSLSATDWEQRLEQMRVKHDFQARLDRPFGMPPLFYNSMYMRQCEKAFAGCDPYAYDLKLPFLSDLVRKCASHRMEFEARNSLHHQADMMAFLSSQKAFTSASTEQPAALPLNKGGISLGEPIVSPASSRSSSVELKIPSYKPMRLFGSQSNGLPDRYSPPQSISESGALNPSSSKINGTLKDIISKTITDKFKSKLSPFSGASSQSGSLPRECSEKADDASPPHSSDDSQPPTRKKIKTDHADSDGGDGRQDEDRDQKPTKKTRPKRGQYRKYNSQLLVEAVKAVQRGEMSVHRAGSYFGVPHSTLEYKVKERHLLRHKKPREPKAKKSSDKSVGSPDSAEEKQPGSSEDGRENSGSGSTEEGRSPSPPEACSPSSGFQGGVMHPAAAAAAAASMPVFPMSGSGLPLGFGWPSMLGNRSLPAPPIPSEFPSFLPTFGLNTSASELLKKLQRKVQAQEAIASPPSGPRDDAESEGPKSEDEGVRATSSSSSSQVAVK